MSANHEPYYLSRIFYDAGVGLVATLLRNPGAIDDVAGRVHPDDFADPDIGELYAAILSLRERSEPVMYDAVAREVIRRGQLKGNVTHTLLAQCLEPPLNGTSAATAEWFADRIREGAQCRRLYTTGLRIVGLADSPPDGDIGQAWGEAERLILDGEPTGGDDGTVDYSTSLIQWTDDLEERTRPNSRSAGIETGLRELDLATAGFRPGQLIVVGARTGVGKTLFALNATRAAAAAGHPVLYFTFEMSRIEINDRMMVAIAGIDGHRFMHRRLENDDVQKLSAAKQSTAHWPIIWADKSDCRIGQLASIARRKWKRNGIRMIVVDYLQLVPTTPSNRKRYEEVGEITRRLKLLANELRVPIIALAQLNRNSEGRADAKPRSSDLRESGNLEQDADVVILLHRAEATPRPGELLEVIVAKQRAGPSGMTCKASLDATTGRITDWAGF